MEKIKALPKFFTLTLLVFLLLIIVNSSLLIKVVHAVAPIPPSGRVPCDVTKNPEFNSSRPYQASPCGDSPKAYFCGNSLQVIEDTPSRTAPLGTKFLNVQMEMPAKTYAADVSGSQFPIEGNTELTANAVNPVSGESLDDATKMNEYLSWYLGGVTNKAEYGQTDPSKIVDFAGPVKKLLPSAIQDAQRIVAINNASKQVTYTGEDGKAVTDKAINHNQIVVCASDQNVTQKLFGIIPYTVKKAIAHECYAGNKSPASGELRLKDWGSNLSILNTFFNFFGAQAWNQRIPPLPWQFKTDILYQKAYNEWRGKQCSIIPIVNQLLCIDVQIPGVADLVSNRWADLFPYVPLSNTTDKNAKNLITGVGINGIGGTQIVKPNTAYEVIHEPILYFPHTAESSELSNALNTTYVPKTGTADTPPADTTEANVNSVGQCRIANLRSNPGDNLFPEVKPSEVRVHVESYTVTQIPCHDVGVTGTKAAEEKGLPPPRPHAACRGQVAIEIRMITKTPYAEEIFNSTTAGANSTFRKIYPKVGEGAPVTCIANIPTDTGVTYTSTENLEKMKVIGPLGNNTTDNAKLYFPYIGSVYDYFLKGIQTALRPLGYGEQPVSGVYCNNITCGELPKNLPKATGSCTMGNPSFNVPQTFRDILSAAGQTYKVPPNLILGIMFGEGAFNPGRYNWTDQNVKNWASCQPLPHCSPGGDTINSVVPFIGVYWNKLAKDILPDLQKIDPNKKAANPCNLLDATFALAKDLHTNAGGSGSLTGKSCFGVQMSSTIPTSCSWSSSQVETAIRVWEFGTAYDSTYQCATKENSCATGGGADANCPTGGDTCDTVDNRYDNKSHNACVWDISTEGGSGNKK